MVKGQVFAPTGVERAVGQSLRHEFGDGMRKAEGALVHETAPAARLQLFVQQAVTCYLPRKLGASCAEANRVRLLHVLDSISWTSVQDA